MTTGEYQYENIFRLQAGGSEEVETATDIAFPPVSYLLWLVFLVFMPILFTNLLVGLLPTSTQQLPLWVYDLLYS